MIPVIPQNVLNNAKSVWDEVIDQYGREVTLAAADGTPVGGAIKAFCKRPKILGLFDRTEQSYDQERYMVMVKAGDMLDPVSPRKFVRVIWDEEDHAVISVTQVDLCGMVFGYRILVKG